MIGGVALAWCGFAGMLALAAFSPRTNLGLLGLALAVLVGAAGFDLGAARALAAFPADLFLDLLGVTLLFGLAEQNGTLAWLLASIMGLTRRLAVALPLILALVVAIITGSGVGNVGAIAMLAAPALAYAARAGLPALPMTVLLVGAANAAALSPTAPTGLILARALQNAGADVGDVAPRVALLSLAIQGAVAVAGFLLLGGARWMRGAQAAARDVAAAPPMTRRVLITVVVLGLFVVAVTAGTLPELRAALPATVARVCSRVGGVALIGAALLMLVGRAEVDGALARLPWPTLLMVCGISTYVEMMRGGGALAPVQELLGRSSTTVAVNFNFALISGVLSAFSSSSGVVLPTLLPMTPAAAADVPGTSLGSLVTSVAVAAHLTDTSPLSSLGALCIAAAQEDRPRLFRNLLWWGLAMAPVGAVLCAALSPLL